MLKELNRLPDQQAALIQKLEVFRDRLLRVDWRNRAILLLRNYQKWTFDLGETWSQSEDTVQHVMDSALSSKNSICIVADSEQSPEGEARRQNLIALSRNMRLIEDETGLHDLYVGFPFLQGHLAPQHYVRAPFVLFPARLEYRKNARPSGWYIVFLEENAILNRPLLAAVCKVGGLPVPDEIQDQLEELLEIVNHDKIAPVTTFHRGIQALLSKAGFRLDDRPYESYGPVTHLSRENITSIPRAQLHLQYHIVLGSFPQASSAIYQDYNALIERAKRGETDQGIIDNLLEVPADEARAASGPFLGELDEVPDSQLNCVLPSDASQDAVIVETQEAECVVVRGPPGTGKSQLIVNLISNALSKKQRVALVCQKRAALDVVFQRLDKARLAQHVVLLHEERADRKPVYDGLNKKLSKGLNPRKSLNLEAQVARTSEHIDEVTRKLNQIVKPLWMEYFGGIKPYQLYLSLDPKFSPRIQLDGTEKKLDYPTFQNFLRKLPQQEEASKRFDHPTHPLSKRTDFAQLGHQDRLSLLRSLEQAQEAAEAPHVCLSDDQSNRTAIVQLEAFTRHHKSRFRFLSREWRKLGRKGEVFLTSRGEPATLEATHKWLPLLLGGLQLFSALDALRPYFAQEIIEELKSLSERSQELKARLLSMADAVEKDFDVVQAHDMRLRELTPPERELADICRNQLLDADDWGRILTQELYFRWVDMIEEQNPDLKGQPFETYLKHRDELQHLLEEKCKELASALSRDLEVLSRTPELPPGDHHWKRSAETDWNKLAYEFGKKRRVKPVRKLLEEFSFHMMRMASCWLMSPETVSEVFPLEGGFFDLVIFDEASQCAVERALPALYRGKRIVIAGDEKQLRPFDLFQIRDEEEELDEALASESLLMLAKRIYGFRYLDWHYRSKYQELIDFSNHAFYEGRLQIAGNIHRRAEPPIRWITTAGVWDQRRNLIEATRVVDEIASILRDFSNADTQPSIGVIAFNDPQMNAILDEIDRRRTLDVEFDELMELAENPKSGNLDDKLFVKNIENVQGDERDLILFSIGYARDHDGKLRLQFGTLNMDGGENRLNVAVTRARHGVIVVSSIDPEDLAVETSVNPGPKLLNQYLQYAQAIGKGEEEWKQQILHDLNPEFLKTRRDANIVNLESPLEQQVRTSLEQLGYTVDTQIGYSGYKIDLAVVHPKDPSRYILAIECDGATFHSARSARERDVVRQRFLEERGWRVARVWSRNWWHNREAEIQRLDGLISHVSEAGGSELTGF